MKVLLIKEFRSKLKNDTIEFFEEDGVLNIEKLINTYNFYIYKILSNRISNELDIEEILSDVFIIFWKKYNKLSGNTEVKPYLIGITKNLIKQKYRDYSINFEDIELYDNDIKEDAVIEDIIENKEKAKIIADSLTRIKEIDKQIFIMFYYHQKKVKEIAKSLKISEAKVKIILHRVRKFIRKNLKERGYNYGK